MQASRDARQRAVRCSGLPDTLYGLKSSLGFDSTRRNNLHLLDDHTLLYATGNVVHLLDLPTLRATFLEGVDIGGVGALAVHPSGKEFVVAGKGTSPPIVVFDYPSLRSTRTLHGGTERAYADVAFSADGKRLASVGSDPDYTLVVWEWATGAIVLKSKAFSQEVFRVSFAPWDSGRLITSGMGHIRFWRMAGTFTGLKLKGDVGKFGGVELSDVSAFTEYPDGKVVCGTEFGSLLMWEGNLIKVEIHRAKDKSCHDGVIDVVLQQDDVIYTAGQDGYVRLWDAKKMESADATDDTSTFFIEPMEEILVAPGVRIKQMLMESGASWLVQNEAGGLWRTDPSRTSTRLLSFHGAGIAAMDTSPLAHLAATAGDDHTVRLWDFITPKQLYQRTFNAAGTCLTWAPVTVDPTGWTVVVGFVDGVVRVLRIASDQFIVKQATKPHSSRVTGLAFSSTGAFLATSGHDGSVFFFQWRDQLIEPLGFVSLALPINDISWCPSRAEFLVGCENGSVLRLSLPENTRRTGSSFEITLPCSRVDFVCDMEEEPSASGDVAIPHKGTNKKDTAIDEEAAQEEAEPTTSLPPPPPPPPLCCTLWWTEDQVLLSVGRSQQNGKLIDWDLNKGTPFVLDADSARVVCLWISHSGRYLVSGAADGTICVRERSSLGRFWKMFLHDGFRGGPSQVRTSFDDKFLLSAGYDGSFFVLEGGESTEHSAAPTLSSAPVFANEAEGTDITTPGHYTIQEEAVRALEDSKINKAEAHKETVRHSLAKMRETVTNVRRINATLSPNMALTDEQFNLDPELVHMLEAEADELVADAGKDLEWDLERQRLLLSKLRRRFLDDIEVEHITLHAFRSGHDVSSFRLCALPDGTKECLGVLMEAVATKRTAEQDRQSVVSKKKSVLPILEEEVRNSCPGGRTTRNTEDSLTGGLSLGERRKQRILQKKKWSQLEEQRPDPHVTDPRDASAIEDASKNVGDWDLMTDPQYMVSDDQEVTVRGKLREMVLLQEAMNRLKADFNTRFLALRDLKHRIIEELLVDNARVRQINDVLNENDGLFDVQHSGLEYPERRDEVADEDVEVFGRRQALEAKTMEKKGDGGLGGFAGFGQNQTAADAEVLAQPRIPPIRPPPATTSLKQIGDSSHGATKMLFVCEEISDIPPSTMEQYEKDVLDKTLHFQKKQLCDKATKAILTFDSALADLCRERLRLAIDLKSAELRFLLLFRELSLLRDFEKKDSALTERLESKRQERAQIASQIMDVSNRLTVKKHDIEAILAVDKQLMEEFTSLISVRSPFYEQLLQVYRKKLKRSKRKGEDDDDGSQVASDRSDGGSSSDESDGEDEDDNATESCPTGCDPALFAAIQQLRERRLDNEILVNEAQRNVEVLRRQNESNASKARIIDSALRQTETEIRAFQTAKQNKLNELPMLVPLRLSQFLYLVDGTLPADLSSAVVFTNTGVQQLKDRIRWYQLEKQELRKQHKDMEKELANEIRVSKGKQMKIAELERKANDIQMLKFGQLVDLEYLERMGSSSSATELQEKLRSVELECHNDMRGWEMKLKEANAQLTSETKRNTDLLHKIADLTQRQRELEVTLNAMSTNIVAEDPLERKKDDEEYALRQKLTNQEVHISNLAVEIEKLRRKDGQIHTTTVDVSDPTKRAGQSSVGAKLYRGRP